MDTIKRIKIENIKGKDVFEVKFNNLIANQPNIVVAPNGFGKSTIATAFKAASNGRMKLCKQDLYNQNQDSHPKLEVELQGDHAGTYFSSDTVGNLSKQFKIFTINSPLYANSTSRNLGNQFISTADLRVEKVVIYNKIPHKCSMKYSYRTITSKYGVKKNLFKNLDSMLNDCDNIKSLLDIKDIVKNCCVLLTIQQIFAHFLEVCSEKETVKNIKKKISIEDIKNVTKNIYVCSLIDCISKMNKKPKGWEEIDNIFTAIQLCTLLKPFFTEKKENILKSVYSFLSYKKTKDLMDKKLELFNTTGRTVRTQEDHEQLVIYFDRALSLSNGERDILSFVANLTKFEVEFIGKMGILIIDEVFDYLDGSNILAVQYYFSQLIDRCKSSNKTLFPIIFTHLDPKVFNNYTFNKSKIHYISLFATNINLNSSIIKLLRCRSSRSNNKDGNHEIEHYFIHYTNKQHFLSSSIANQISIDFKDSNFQLRDLMYSEINDKYLLEKEYDPIMVVVGIRIRIEEIVFKKLKKEHQDGFISEHTVKNKLLFAEEHGVNVPELYYILSLIYNDALHLNGDDDAVMLKIKTCYLKINSKIIINIVRSLFLESLDSIKTS